MITKKKKKIFNRAGKKTEMFVREVISAFPKIEIVENIRHCMDHTNCCDIFIDLKKAFDTGP